MPQFDFATWPGQIVWLLVVFGLLYVAFARLFLPRMRSTIELRHGRINGDMAEARRLRDEAEAEAESVKAELAEARNRAQRTAADARAKAGAEAASRQAAQEAELNEKLAAAEGRIRTARDRAMGEVRGIAAETAAAIAEKLSGRPSTEAEIDQALRSLGDAQPGAAG